MTDASPVVHIVDDDEAIRDALSALIEAEGLEARSHAAPQAFLDDCDPQHAGCAVLDLQMPGLSGLDLQAELHRRGIELPVIFLTGHGDVPAAVSALKEGAVDFLQKPFDDVRLLAAIRHAVELDAKARRQRRRAAGEAELFSRLTGREREVMERIVAGKANKVIAAELGISERTVELHRSRVMHKLEVRSVAELVRLAGSGGARRGAG